MLSINLYNIAILNIPSVDYRCSVSEICICEAVNLLKNADLNERTGTL